MISQLNSSRPESYTVSRTHELEVTDSLAGPRRPLSLARTPPFHLSKPFLSPLRRPKRSAGQGPTEKRSLRALVDLLQEDLDDLLELYGDQRRLHIAYRVYIEYK